ncbi:hypothetical protein [Plantactinospora sp. KLBMP9567]|uniref:hypothetical protein n=1 Tax=Plantactinospora sp. KLBMP9567 TaxID=3085900 RepID=UPI002982A909|nr:hypothetical protein [Plantactinospora sp. KLBMP9567]MDW5328993.1 hypothetical protein [Plantactinospora sp. KLBMP9567]
MTVSTAATGVARRISWQTGCALLAVLLSAGCGARRDSDVAENPTSSPSSTAASAVATASPTPTPAPDATTPAPIRVRAAADGRRYAACADGTCEVAVTKPVRIRVDGGTFSVTKVKRDVQLDFKLTMPTGAGGSGTLKSCGVMKFYLGGGGGVVTCGADGVPERPARERGALLVQLAGWTSDGAGVLRLVSG